MAEEGAPPPDAVKEANVEEPKEPEGSGDAGDGSSGADGGGAAGADSSAVVERRASGDADAEAAAAASGEEQESPTAASERDGGGTRTSAGSGAGTGNGGGDEGPQLTPRSREANDDGLRSQPRSRLTSEVSLPAGVAPLGAGDDDDDDDEDEADLDEDDGSATDADVIDPAKARTIAALETENAQLEEEISDTVRKIEAAKLQSTLSRPGSSASSGSDFDAEKHKVDVEETTLKLKELDDQVQDAFKELSKVQTINKALKKELKEIQSRPGVKTVEETEAEMADLLAEFEEEQAKNEELEEFKPMLAEWRAEHEEGGEGAEETHVEWLRRTEEELRLVKEQSRNAILIAKAREAEYEVKGRKMRAMQEESLALAAELRACREEHRDSQKALTMSEEERRMDVERRAWKKQRLAIQKKMAAINREMAGREDEAMRRAAIAEAKIAPARARLDAVQNKLFEVELKLSEVSGQKDYLRRQVEDLGGRVSTAELLAPADHSTMLPRVSTKGNMRPNGRARGGRPGPDRRKKGGRRERGEEVRQRDSSSSPTKRKKRGKKKRAPQAADDA